MCFHAFICVTEDLLDFNQATDMNLVDAVLFKATRIGHGFAFLAHP